MTSDFTHGSSNTASVWLDTDTATVQANPTPFEAAPAVPGMPWQLASIGQSNGVRANGARLWETAGTDATPVTYRSDTRDSIAALAAAVNAVQTGVRDAYRLAQEGVNVYLPKVRRERAEQAFDAASVSVDQNLTKSRDALDRLQRRLVDDAKPARPSTVTDGSEAAAKSDLQMRLGPVPVDELADRALRLAADAVANRDDTTAWLLAVSPWGQWYLESRGADAHTLSRYVQGVEQVAPPAPHQQAARTMRSMLDAVEQLHRQVKQTIVGARRRDQEHVSQWLTSAIGGGA